MNCVLFSESSFLRYLAFLGSMLGREFVSLLVRSMMRLSFYAGGWRDSSEGERSSRMAYFYRWDF